jgi:hypothetical protein
MKKTVKEKFSNKKEILAVVVAFFASMTLIIIDGKFHLDDLPNILIIAFWIASLGIISILIADKRKTKIALGLGSVALLVIFEVLRVLYQGSTLIETLVFFNFYALFYIFAFWAFSIIKKVYFIIKWQIKK